MSRRTGRWGRALPTGMARALFAGLLAMSVVAGCSSDKGGSSKAADATSKVGFDFSGTAAKVDGTDLPAARIADALAVFKAAPAALERAFGTTEITQPGSDQPDPAVVAELLSTEIAVQLIQNEIARRGLTISDSARSLAETQVAGYFGDALDTQPAYKKELADRYAQYVVLDQALAGPAPDEAALRAEYAKNPGAYDEACARHILVATEAEAKALVADLGAGGDFAALAKAKSIDTGSGAGGGELGCQGRGVYVPEFEAAVWNGPVGVVQGPVKTQFGYHVIVVSQRRTRTFEDARADIANALAPEPFAALQNWLIQEWGSRPISVDPRFGTWDPDAGRVTPRGVSTDGVTVGSGPAPGK